MPTDPLDALVAAPRHHTLLLENERVRVLDTRIAPGETVPLHTHAWPAVYYVLAYADIIRRDEHGRITFDSRNMPNPLPGQALWAAPLAPHTLENVGATEVHVISVELKQPG